MHPIDTAKAVFGQQKQLAGEGVNAFRSGDYPLAAARAVETLMPGVGPNIAGGFKTIKSGDVSGGVGDIIGGTGSALAFKGASLSPKVRAFAGGMKDAATENVPSFRVGHVTVQASVPKPLAGAFTGAALGRMIGHPIPGAVAGAVAPVLLGGMRAAEGEPWLPSIEPMPWMRGSSSAPSAGPRGYFQRPPIVTPAPGGGDASGAIYNPRNNPMVRPAAQLPAAPRVFQMPSGPDASFVRGVPGEYAVPYQAEILSGPLTRPEAALAPLPVSAEDAAYQDALREHQASQQPAGSGSAPALAPALVPPKVPVRTEGPAGRVAWDHSGIKAPSRSRAKFDPVTKKRL
jgi:hypothetical protein